MKKVRVSNSLLWIVLLAPAVIFSQHFSQDTLKSSDDFPEFIEPYQEQLNVRLEAQKDNETLDLFVDGKGLTLKPNLKVRYALGFNYKFASVKFGFRPKVSEQSMEEKGESDFFSLKLMFLLKNWAHSWDILKIKGFYVDGSENVDLQITNNNNRVRFPNLKTKFFNGLSQYKFNPNYSLRATRSQTEIQIKSAGSLVAGVEYSIYDFDGLNRYLTPAGDLVERSDYNSFLGLYTGINTGYYYTFVHKKYWYVHAFALPGVGMDFYKVYTKGGETTTRNVKDFILTFKTGFAAGYSGPKYYFGANYYYNLLTERDLIGIDFRNQINSFNAFIGYRFKAPKTIRKPIDNMEKTIPILNK